MNVIMPQLGETVAEGRVAAWFKAVGDRVEAGDNLFEIETDKVSMEVQATESGVLSEIRVGAGQTVPVGTVVAVLAGANGPVAVPAVPATQVPDPPPALPGAGSIPLDPFEEVRTPRQGHGPARGPLGLRITPLARRLIGQRGIDIEALARAVAARGGSRIAAADVAEAAAPAPVPVPAAPAEPAAGQPPHRLRAQTAARLAEAWRTAPHVYQAVEIDFSRIERARQAARQAFAERHGVALTALPFVARAVCLALAEFPRINATYQQDRLVVHGAVHLGIAVDLDHDGLVVPVVRDADGLTVAGLARAIARQADRARAGKLAPDDLAGGTYTITNNGRFGTLFTTPIINVPQVAILSMDAVRKRPVVVETEDGDLVVARPAGMVGQSFDHRAFDGAYAAAFLSRLKALAETRDWAAELA